jgi:hypothetical protein
MSDISEITLHNGETYSLKDATAREHLVPENGSVGQVLTKTSNGAEWADAGGGGGGEGQSYVVTTSGNVTINITDAEGTPVLSVADVPDVHGGIEKRITAIDISDTDATAEDVAQGKVFYSNTGTRTTGTAVNGEWTTEGIARNQEPNGDIVLKAFQTNQWLFAYDCAFAYKPITSVVFDASTASNFPTARLTFGNQVFKGSSLERVTDSSFINFLPTQTLTLYSAFQEMKNLKIFETTTITVNFSGYGSAFSEDSALTRVSLPNAIGSTAYNVCQNCYALEYADFGSIDTLNGNSFRNNYVLQTLILRRTSLVNLGNNPSSSFYNTPFLGYNDLSGKIYVPQALISDYQTATNWSTLYNAGHCTFVAIEGSEYEL